MYPNTAFFNFKKKFIYIYIYFRNCSRDEKNKRTQKERARAPKTQKSKVHKVFLMDQSFQRNFNEGATFLAIRLINFIHFLK